MTHRHRTSLFVFGSLVALGVLACSDAGSNGAETGGAGAACMTGVACGTECVDTTTSSSHCGACNNPCAAGLPCIGGVCGCAAGTSLCGSVCANTQTDPQHCGPSCTPCATGATCAAGVCSCSPGLTSCGTACVNTQGDGQNCGFCGNVCTAPAVCSAGTCSSTGCIAPLVQCGTSCVNTTTDPANCGNCGVSCGAGQTCAGGTCICATGTLCGTSCVDTQTSALNCGACGIACGVGYTCQAGVCAGGGTGGTGGAGGGPTGGVPAGGGPTGGVSTGGGPAGGGPAGGASTGGVSTGGGPTGGAGGGGSCSDLTFTISETQSSAIATVFTVDWSVSGPIRSAHIDFGRSASSWEYQAPVPSPSQSGNSTMLLGMKENTDYSYQITIEREDQTTCTSSVRQIRTGYNISGLPTFTVTNGSGGTPFEGFTVACVFGMGMGFPGDPSGGSVSFILDKEGDYVWAYKSNQAGSDCVRSLMSYDGQYMWIANGNVPGPASGTLARVKMDGTGEQAYQVPNRHHDITLTPDEHIFYIEYKDGNTNGCDVVKELDPSGGSGTLVYDAIQANPGFSSSCHSNAINWWPDQNLFTLSVMYWDSIIAFSREGALSWKFGGQISSYSGASWSRQHQHHLLSASSILLFNNDGGNGSAMLEYTFSGSSATRTWDFSNGNSTQSMGDVKRLPNGNTLITYSNQGIILEVSSSKQEVRRLAAGNGSGVGYSTRRTSLYGPPPPYQD